jgi:hypothetical protein
MITPSFCNLIGVGGFFHTKRSGCGNRWPTRWLTTLPGLVADLISNNTVGISRTEMQQ